MDESLDISHVNGRGACGLRACTCLEFLPGYDASASSFEMVGMRKTEPFMSIDSWFCGKCQTKGLVADTIQTYGGDRLGAWYPRLASSQVSPHCTHQTAATPQCSGRARPCSGRQTPDTLSTNNQQYLVQSAITPTAES